MCSSLGAVIAISLTFLLGLPFTALFYKTLCCATAASNSDEDSHNLAVTVDQSGATTAPKNDNSTNITNIRSITVASITAFTLLLLGYLGAWLAGILDCAGADEDIVASVETYVSTVTYGFAVLFMPFIYYLVLKHIYREYISDKQIRTMQIMYVLIAFLLVLWFVFFLTFERGGAIQLSLSMLFIIIYLGFYGYLIRLFYISAKNEDCKIDNSKRYLISIIIAFGSSMLAYIMMISFIILGDDDASTGLDFDDTVLAFDCLVNFIAIGLLFEFNAADFVYEKLTIVCGNCLKI